MDEDAVVKSVLSEGELLRRCSRRSVIQEFRSCVGQFGAGGVAIIRDC